MGYLYLPAVATSHIALMIMVLGAVASSGFRALKKPDEDWYQFRALAESVKTLTWRFSTRSEPFDSDDKSAKDGFRNSLIELLRVNAALGPRFAGYKPEADQITSEMLELRKSDLPNRKSYYLKERIQDQRVWYKRKSAVNKSSAKIW
jgi:hypothetical protein